MSDNKDFTMEPWWKQTKDDYTKYRSAGVDYTVNDLIGREDGTMVTGLVATKNIKKFTYNFVFVATDETKTVNIDSKLSIKGSIIKVIATIPDWANPVTTTISVLNEDSKEVWKHLALMGNDEYDITLANNKCILLGHTGEQIKADLSGQPGVGGTVVITIYVEG